MSAQTHATPGASDADAEATEGRVYNVAAEGEHSLLELLDVLQRLLGTSIASSHVAPRAGDVRNSRADCASAHSDLRWGAQLSFEEGLARTVTWLADA